MNSVSMTAQVSEELSVLALVAAWESISYRVTTVQLFIIFVNWLLETILV